MLNAPEITSTRPYLIRAMHEWCIDNGFTPYLRVSVNDSVQVPREFVKDGEIILNVSYETTGSLQLGNDFIEFKARFGGVARDIMVPVGRVVAIYARENGQGMAFPVPTDNLADGVSPLLPPASFGVSEPKGVSERQEPVPERGAPQLVPVDSNSGAGQTKPDHEGPDGKPPAGGGSRPSLKLVK